MKLINNYYANSHKPFVSTEGLTYKMKVGLPLEKALHKVYEILGVEHECNDFDWRYAFQLRGIDSFDIFGNAVECKNFNGSYRVSYEFIDREIVQRYPSDARRKFLVISYNIFSEGQLYYLQTYNITVLTLGIQVNYSNYNKAVQTLIKLIYPYIPTNNKPINSNNHILSNNTTNITLCDTPPSITLVYYLVNKKRAFSTPKIDRRGDKIINKGKG